MSSQSNRAHVTLNTLADRKRNGVKFAALTAYDALFAELISTAGVAPSANRLNVIGPGAIRNTQIQMGQCASR